MSSAPGIPQVRERHGAAVVGVRRAYGLRNINKLAFAVIEPQAFLLVTGKAAAVECRPVCGVADNGTVAAGHLCKVVPVALLAVE